MLILQNDNETELALDEMNRLTKVAYRPEKGKDVLVIWCEVNGIVFERSYSYENYKKAREDFEKLKTLSISLEKEVDMLLEDIDDIVHAGCSC